LGVKPGDVCTITEIARDYGISRNHLVKVVHNLGILGYIKTVRGRGGGLMLSRDASSINIGDVVRHTEGSFNLVECFDRNINTCPISPMCALKGALYTAQNQFLEVLDRFTLADVVGNRRELSKLLGVPVVVEVL
jgi:Rrf2 family nitric oxide-sensitive transcriptional repressor